MFAYINATRMMVEGKEEMYKLDGDTVLRDDEGNLLAVGGAAILAEVLPGDKVADIKVVNGVVVSFVRVATDAEKSQAKVDNVKDLITALPTTITLADKAKVEAARAAYDALTATEKALVTNYDTLTTAEATLKPLADADKFKTDHARILGLSLVPNSATEIKADDIRDARAADKAFNALSAAAQLLVVNANGTTAQLLAGAEGRFLVDVNLINTTKNMVPKLTLLDRVPFNVLDADKKAEVAQLLIAARGAGGFANFAAIEPAIDSAITEHGTLLSAVNNAALTATMETALNNLKAKVAPTITITPEMADAVIADKGTGFKLFAEIVAVIEPMLP